MKDNYLAQALYLFTYSILALFILSLIPPFTVGNFTFKEINLISDLAPEVQEEILTQPESVVDTLISAEPEIAVKADTCKTGVICIEDYSPDGNALESFILSLDYVDSKSARIAFYGDSFIEGDILTSSLRDTLQQVFGGRGVGYVPITSEVAKFRTTIKHAFENWQTHSIVGEYEEEPVFGIGGLSAVPLEGNVVSYSLAFGGSFNKLSVFYAAQAARKLNYTIRDTLSIDTILAPTASVKKIDLVSLKSKSISIQITPPDSLQLFGIAIEDNTGLYVDNLAMRGNSGIALSRIQSSVMRDFQRMRPYSLIILQFGLNVVSESDTTDYTGYIQSMTRVVSKFKEAFQGCSILIVSVSDRSSNQGGTFKTIPGILAMRQAQRLIAKKSGVAFWDLFEAMGGENSMPKFVSAKPPMAGKDYTHLNFRGGKYVAKRLADALLYQKELYVKSKAGI
jgi:lysophospholipase L1-like esterase